MLYILCLVKQKNETEKPYATNRISINSHFLKSGDNNSYQNSFPTGINNKQAVLEVNFHN